MKNIIILDAIQCLETRIAELKVWSKKEEEFLSSKIKDLEEFMILNRENIKNEGL